jgi:hypothetical protein
MRSVTIPANNTTISAGSAVKILRLFRQLFGTPPPKFGPGRADVINTINQALFNLDKLLFMGYIYFKCNKDHLAETLICIFGEPPPGEIAT